MRENLNGWDGYSSLIDGTANEDSLHVANQNYRYMPQLSRSHNGEGLNVSPQEIRIGNNILSLFLKYRIAQKGEKCYFDDDLRTAVY